MKITFLDIVIVSLYDVTKSRFKTLYTYIKILFYGYFMFVIDTKSYDVGKSTFMPRFLLMFRERALPYNL